MKAHGHRCSTLSVRDLGSAVGDNTLYESHCHADDTLSSPIIGPWMSRPLAGVVEEEKRNTPLVGRLSSPTPHPRPPRLRQLARRGAEGALGSTSALGLNLLGIQVSRAKAITMSS